MIIGASEEDAEERLANVKAELESIDLLLEDYPKVCFPIRALEGIVARAQGQVCEGERTRIEWGAKQIVLPSIKGSAAAGAIAKVTGISGRVRGMNFKRPDGTSVRPDLVVVDDAQTEEPAQPDTEQAMRGRAGLHAARSGGSRQGHQPLHVLHRDSVRRRAPYPQTRRTRRK